MNATQRKEGSRFYQELLSIIGEINAGGSGGLRQTYRSAVVNGMGLADSFCGKIKTGQYTPSLERIESLAQYLGVPPYSFTEYYRRFAQHMAQEDPDFADIFRVLAKMTPAQARIVKEALRDYTEEISAKIESIPHKQNRQKAMVTR